MTESFWSEQLTPEVRQVLHVNHSLYMAAALPSRIADAADAVVEDGLVEAWLVHVRTLTEFLLVHPANPKKDFSAADFGWNGAAAIKTSSLSEVWKAASAHLVHMSKQRVPDDLAALGSFDRSPVALAAISLTVLDLAEEFVNVLVEQRPQHPMAERFRSGVDQARRAI